MPIYTIQTPEGKKLKIEAADEATAIRGAQDWSRQNAPKAKARARLEQSLNAASRVPVIGKVLQDFNDSTMARARGTAFGFLDEAQGGIYAAGNALTNVVANATGQQGTGLNAREAYEVARDYSRERDAAYAKAHPVNNLVQQVAGGAWAPGARYIGAARSVPQAATRAAAIGGAYGAVSGAGSAEGGVKSRVRGATTGAVVGGALGGSAPLVARGASAVARGSKGAATEVIDRVRTGLGGNLAEPSAAQVQRGNALALDYVGELAAKAPKNALATAAEAAGKPITAAEALGRTGVTQLGAIARRYGSTGDALESALRQRQQAMPERVLADMSNATGLTPEAAAGDVEHIVEAGRMAAAPLFKASLEAIPGPLESPALNVLKSRPVIKKALATVASDLLNEGKDPSAAGIIVRGELPGGLPDVVEVRGATAETWDAVRRAVGRQVERNPITGKPLPDAQSQGNYGVGVATRDLTKALKDAIPGYDEALAQSADYLKIDGAFSNARKLMRPEVPVSVFNKAFDALSGPEKQAHIAGFVNEAYQRAMNGRLKLSDMRSPSFVAKLTKMVGKDRADILLSKLAIETDLARTGSRMNPGVNSPTFEFEQAAKEQDAAANEMVGAVKTALGGRPVTATLQAIASPVVNAYRGARVPLDRATRDEVGRLLQLSPSELDRVLKAASVQRGAKPPMPKFKNTAPAAPALSRAATNQPGREQ